MSSKSIPSEVKKEVERRVTAFNQNVIRNPNIYYLTRYRGRFLYLERYNYGRSVPICRLEYTGSIDNWEFAIFKHSDEQYDPEEWFFPGVGHVDGTVEGAMKAGLDAYPPQRQLLSSTKAFQHRSVIFQSFIWFSKLGAINPAAVEIRVRW